MINLFVTYRCNLACPYCFARGFAREFPRDMSREAFGDALAWMERAGLAAAAFLGGEPTLHPDLHWMVERAARAGIQPVVFTNGLFGRELAQRLAEHAANFVVNYNDPDILAPFQRETLHAALETLAGLGARVTFSKNFSTRHAGYAYLLEGAARHGVTSVRYDISRPDAAHANDHFRQGEARRMAGHIVSFVRACQAQGVRTGLDCCARLCDFDPDDRRYLERESMKFRGICHPSVDVHPDLSASYCLPLADVRVPRVTAFPGWEALMEHFAGMARPLRALAARGECLHCPDFGRRCQGGCLALARRAPGPAQHPTPSPGASAS